MDNVRILVEGTDTYDNSAKEKRLILSNPPLLNWAKPIHWSELKRLLS